MAALVDSIDEPVTLLGHSYGALIALEAALRTDNLQGLVLDDLVDMGTQTLELKWLGRAQPLYSAAEF